MPTVYTEAMLVLIVASVQGVANQQAARVDPTSQGDTFTVGLSPTGQAPATHYWCNWWMTEGQRASFVNYLDALVQSDRAWIYDSEVVSPDAVLAERGLVPLGAFHP